MRKYWAFFLVMGGVLASCSSESVRTKKELLPATGETLGRNSVIAFMTDFGTVDEAVSVCKGVMLGLNPLATIVDITHQVKAYSIKDGARMLAIAAPNFPKSTVFVVVVDPGVGSKRKAMVARTKSGQTFVLPDNGLMSHVFENDALESAREITNTLWMNREGISSTFHGRDIFSSVAARISRGDDWSSVGPEIKEPLKLPVEKSRRVGNTLEGDAITLDGEYGNVVTNIPVSEFADLGVQVGDVISVRIGKKVVVLKYVNTFSDVQENESLAYPDSKKHLAFAVNMGNFATKFGIHVPVKVRIEKGKRK